MRKAAEQTSEQKKLHAKHRKERQQRLALRQQLRGKLVQALRGKLLNSSRAELLGTLVPQARKLSSVTKPSVKSKPSAKTKLSKLAKKSVLDKAENKQKLKKDADKAILDEVKATKQAAAKSKGRGRPKKQPEEDLPPLPPPSCPPPELLEQTVICHAEAAGAKLFGVSGTATDFKAGSHSVLTLSGTFSIPAEYLRSHDPKKETKAFVWPRWTQVSRAELQDLLRQLYCQPEPTLNENESLSAILLPVPKHNKPFLVEDQWRWLGWGLLRWALRKAKAALPEEFSVNCVDPALAHLLKAYPESENYEARVNALRAAVAPFKVVLIPIFASDHWTTLVLEKATGAD